MMSLIIVACEQPPEADQLRRFALRETARIDGEEAGFSGIVDVALLPGGSVAVAQRVAKSVHFYSAAGVRLGSFGREGEGPGEFAGINSLMTTGDTLWIMDIRRRRATGVIGITEFVGVRRMPSLAERYGWVMPVAIYSDGSAIANAEVGGVFTLIRADSAGVATVMQSLQTESGDGHVIQVGNEMIPAQLLPNSPKQAVANDGQKVAVVRSRMEGKFGGTVDVLVMNAYGDTIFQASHPFVGVPITRQIADSLIDRRAKLFPPELAGPFRRGVVLPEIFPPVTDVKFTSTGGLWIRLVDARPGCAYLILKSTGDADGCVAVPDNVTVTAIDGEDVWAVVTDSMDVPSLIRYRMLPGR